MKFLRYAVFTLLIASCNLPIPQPVKIESFTPLPLITIVASSTATYIPFETPTPIPPSPTETLTPCDPVLGYCITAGNFVLERPIQPPGSDVIDLSYPYASTQKGKRDAHHGVEFQNAFGTEVHAAGDGEVVFADSDSAVKFSPWNNFYGNVVVIRHPNELFTLYAHLSNILVMPGQGVHEGDVIGNVGQSGGATGPHLHFEVRQGNDYTEYFSTQNPELWLRPQTGMGAISITLKSGEDRNYERPLVITRLAEDGMTVLFTHYLTSYAKGFEHNIEDAVLNNLPPGTYKIAFNDTSGLRERIVVVQAGKLTEVVFELK